MTNEEAIEALTSNVVENPELMYEALDMAIKALEQQHCEDCVNREAVAEMLNEMPMKITETWMDFYRKALNSLNKLPSVTPTRPKGKWKRISPAGIYECTNCNQVIMTSDIDCYKFCHGCGVRMEGKE